MPMLTAQPLESQTSMTNADLIDLVERYFSAVDEERLGDILALMTPDCTFNVPTHSVSLQGHDQITAMFRRLWANHRAVRHHGFAYVCDPGAGRVAVQFQVENTETDGSLTHKSNCNFFDVAAGQFTAISVYMAGANTLNTA